MKFIVDRRTWYRGHKSQDSSVNDSRLLRFDGTRCCIGFVGQQCGIPDKFLLNKSTAYTAREDKHHNWPKWMVAYVNKDITLAYHKNDAAYLSDKQREDTLKVIFERNGDEIEFVN